MIQIALMQDRLHKRFSVEQDEYNAAIAHHKLVQDPQVLRILEEFESQYPEELKQKIVRNLVYNPQDDEYMDEDAAFYNASSTHHHNANLPSVNNNLPGVGGGIGNLANMGGAGSGTGTITD